jgi:hypothetical protein
MTYRKSFFYGATILAVGGFLPFNNFSMAQTSNVDKEVNELKEEINSLKGNSLYMEYLKMRSGCNVAHVSHLLEHFPNHSLITSPLLGNGDK